MTTYFESPNATIYHGDCLQVLPAFRDASVDAIVTDPPYGLSFMGKQWDHRVPGPEFWKEALRVAKPGAYLLAFGGTRTFHRLACAIEDAGWELRDTIMWVYGSGFPKSLDVSKAIDKAAGAEREVVGAKQWAGYGTALKPAYEPILVCRKPLEGTVAANVQKHGCGALNIVGGRVASEGGLTRPARQGKGVTGGWAGYVQPGGEYGTQDGLGRFPANLIHDGSSEVLELFPETKSGTMKAGTRREGIGFNGGLGSEVRNTFEGSEGSAARFFYCAKAPPSERTEGQHPTVKPLALMRYLTTLIKPPTERPVLLDLFMGSGSTLIAAEDWWSVGIDQEEAYCELAKNRLVLQGSTK